MARRNAGRTVQSDDTLFDIVELIRDRDRVGQFHRAELASEIDIEFRYPLPRVALSDRDVSADLSFLREQIRRENYATHDGRPVLTVGLLTRFLADVDASERLRDSHRSLMGWIHG